MRIYTLLKKICQEIRTLKGIQGCVIEKVLWTNPSPTSAFGAKNITLNMTGYDGYKIVAGFHSTVPYNVVKSGDFDTMSGLLLNCNDSGAVYRRNVPVTGTASARKFEFSEATRDGAVENNYLVPIRIYGVKHFLSGGVVKLLNYVRRCYTCVFTPC